MRILLIVQNYPPERGPVRYGALVARGLAARGHQVTVLTGLPHYPMGKPYPGFGRWRTVRRVEDGVDVIRIPVIMASNRQLWRRVLGFLSFVVAAIPKLVTLRRADVIIASMPPPTVAAVGMFASLIHRRRYIAILRDIEPLRTLTIRGLARGIVGRVLIRLSIWLYRRARQLVVVHPNEQDTLQKLGMRAENITVIVHGVDVDAYAAPGTSDGTVPLPRRDGRLLALYLGTLGYVHALPQLISALADPRIRELPVDVIILGEGECRNECQSLVEARDLGRIVLMPPVPLEAVPAMLQQADVLVCSFRDEAESQLGSKFYEYCAAGKPILVHGRSAAADLVHDIGNGISCREGDADGLLRALSDFRQRPEHWSKMGKVGQQYARAHFEQRLRDQQWEELIKSLQFPS